MKNPPNSRVLAVKGMLDTLVGFEAKTLEQSIEDERAAVHLTQGTPDAKEGMLAFLEKREPKFNQARDDAHYKAGEITASLCSACATIWSRRHFTGCL